MANLDATPKDDGFALNGNFTSEDIDLAFDVDSPDEQLYFDLMHAWHTKKLSEQYSLLSQLAKLGEDHSQATSLNASAKVEPRP